MTESKDTRARERLERFVGEWTMQATPPGGPPWPGEARVTFDWLADGVPLLVQRWHVDLPEAPDGTAVLGCDGRSGGYFQFYTDERDVQRVYAMTLDDDGVWTLHSDGEPFSQRFTGTVSADGQSISGRWEMDEGEGWRTDFDLRYSRVS